MNAEQKQQIEQALRDWETDSSDMFSYEETCEVFAALLQELVDAPEPKSCGWIRAIDEAMVTHHLGVADIADDYEAAKKKLNTLLCLNQDIGEYFSAKAPTPSVPDVDWLSNVIRSVDGSHQLGAGALAEKICEAMLAATPTPAEAPADVARDVRLQVEAEFAALLPGVTYMDEPDGGSPTVQEQVKRMAKDAERYRLLRKRYWSGNLLDAEVDAAIEREILGGQVE